MNKHIKKLARDSHGRLSFEQARKLFKNLALSEADFQKALNFLDGEPDVPDWAQWITFPTGGIVTVSGNTQYYSYSTYTISGVSAINISSTNNCLTFQIPYNGNP